MSPEMAKRRIEWYGAKIASIKDEHGAINCMSDDEMRKELLAYMNRSKTKRRLSTHYGWIRTPKGIMEHPVIFFWGEVYVKGDWEESVVLQNLLVHERDMAAERHSRAKASAWTRRNKAGAA
jgi:hypothetical protein